MAKQQLKELKERWQEKKADFQRSDTVATMNARLLKDPTPGREGGGREGPRPNTARWCEEIGQKQISSPLPGRL